MTPAEHYREAERLLGVRRNPRFNAEAPDIARAQVHAILATCDLERLAGVLGWLEPR